MAGKYSELSFFSHRVCVKLEGYRLERLADQAHQAGLHLKHFRMISSTEAVCWVSASDLKLLKNLCRSAYRLTELHERGAVFSAVCFLKRPALVTGCILALTIVVGQSFFIRSIQVSGYRSIPETQLLQYLENQGIYEGAYRPGINWAAAEQNIYAAFPEITWADLAYSGRLAVLRIAETDHDIYEKDRQDYSSAQARETYSNIVAEEAGYIETILPFYGTALAEEGDYVEKGQVLISGRVPLEPTTFKPEDELEKEYFVNAEGDVWAKVPYRITFNQERYLWGEPAESGGEAVVSKAEKTEEQAKRKAEQQIRLWTKENLPESAEILKKSLKFSRFGNIIEVSVLLEVRQQIGTKQEEFIGTKDTDTRNN